MRAADAIVKILIANDVDVIFGVPGDTSMTFHNAIEAHSDQIKYIQCRDERHATYMADTYARVSGKPGVVDVPSGGGVLYATPGISEANSSSVPIICFSSDISMSSEETGALTELKQVELLQSITKWNTKIKLASKIPHMLRKAFRMATGGRPGAVHISVPEDVHEEHYDYTDEELYASFHKPFKSSPNREDVEKVYKLLTHSSRPVIIAGGGVHLSAAYEELESLASDFSIPVGTSINGKGSIAENLPQAIGVIGVNGGTDETNSIIKNADFVLVLGSKLNNVTTVAKSIFSHSPVVVQVDISEEILDQNIRTDVAIMSDIKAFLNHLNLLMNNRNKDFSNSLTEWNKFYQDILNKKVNRVAIEVQEDTKFVNPAKIIDLLNKHTNENALFVIDAGTQNPYMASDYVTKKAGRRTVFDRGHGNLGYALSAAIGAKVASPQSKVFSMFGDGSFAMSVGELETASRLGLPVVFLLFQNNSYGWIKKLHQLYYDERYIGVDFSQINGAKIAEGFNISSLRIDSNEKLEEGLKWAIDQQGPVFLDILIEPITDIVPPVTNWREDSKLDPSEREALTY
ncbi:thiamine pyrophosphate-binding protein [Bacillus sp. DTU_2020_1000418_1_SI_GHA_SEK_038]|uniref:thiamine pyrophosphate-binding protein n=1 Tax=Bacillus sp. DTU_2020_1000418_1_SI_GHA_SEK_038 TaxID=3077585 RepID=UPI0028E32E2A|nr:thiamine pyrophosphate-binding protein [Bacillus sp. DTU_2020_1000418_1_SI_GHA_SEK_038]WNS75153.1 thiamine pyrophosphate-binding protein [Bacillus sp. DTU_2020_1000418_1_SI_GHA_SEK_038]